MNLKKAVLFLLIVVFCAEGALADKIIVRATSVPGSEINDKNTGSYQHPVYGQIDWEQEDYFTVGASNGFAVGYEKELNKRWGLVVGIATLGERKISDQESYIKLRSVETGEEQRYSGSASEDDAGFLLSMPLYLQLKYYLNDRQSSYVGVQAHALNTQMRGDGWGDWRLYGHHGYGVINGYNFGSFNLEISYLVNKYIFAAPEADELKIPNAEDTMLSLSLGYNFDLDKKAAYASGRKDPFNTAAMSFFVPSLGQAYAGDWLRSFWLVGLEAFCIVKSMETEEYERFVGYNIDPFNGFSAVTETSTRPISDADNYRTMAVILHLWQTFDAYHAANDHNNKLEEGLKLEVEEGKVYLMKEVVL